LSLVAPLDLPPFPTRRSSDLEGATARLRPILMTSLTTLFAVIPLAFSQGDGSEFQIPMAIVVTGGLLVSTLLSLFLLPGFLSLRSEEHTSELQSRENLVCRLL